MSQWLVPPQVKTAVSPASVGEPGWARVSTGDRSWGLRWSLDVSKPGNQGGHLQGQPVQSHCVPLEDLSLTPTRVLINACYLPFHICCTSGVLTVFSVYSIGVSLVAQLVKNPLVSMGCGFDP